MLHELVTFDLLCYPKILNIGAQYHHFGECYGTESDPEHLFLPRSVRHHVKVQGKLDVGRILESCLPTIKSLLEVCPYVGNDEQLYQDILKEGNIGTTLGFLLTLLPNLTSIHISGYGHQSNDSESLNKFATRILKAAPQSPSNSSLQPLSKLNHMSFNRGADPEPFDLCFYWPFLHLPSLRSLRGEFIDASDNDWSYARLALHVEELDFECCCIDEQSFDTYLKDIINLRKLRHHRMAISHDGNFGVPLPKLTQMLVQYAGESLQSLEITIDILDPELAASGCYFIGTLKAFKTLAYVILSGSMLIDEAEPTEKQHELGGTISYGRVCRLIDVLPASVVRIDVNYKVLKGTAPAMLAGLPDLKAEHLPNLEIIQFYHRSNETLGIAQETKRAFMDAGIRLIADDPNILEWVH